MGKIGFVDPAREVPPATFATRHPDIGGLRNLLWERLAPQNPPSNRCPHLDGTSPQRRSHWDRGMCHNCYCQARQRAERYLYFPPGLTETM